MDVACWRDGWNGEESTSITMITDGWVTMDVLESTVAGNNVGSTGAGNNVGSTVASNYVGSSP